MSEWWTVWSTYRPSSFLLFSRQTYYRLVELYNADIFPLQIVALLAGVAIVVLVRSRRPWSGRAIAILLALCWIWIAWAFHWQRYATINWAAQYFAAAFAIEALVLLWLSARDRLGFDLTRVRARFGIGIFVFALIVVPFAQVALGRPWSQIEAFGVMPDPTAIATLGLLLAATRVAWSALPIPVLWSMLALVTTWQLHSR